MYEKSSDEEKQKLSFRDEGTLQRTILTIGNVLTEYFAYSPFYSQDSLNEFNSNRNEDIRDLYDKEGLLYRLTYVKLTDRNFLNMNRKPNEPEITEKILEGDEIDLPENRGYPVSVGFVEITSFLNRKDENGDVHSMRQAKYFMIDGTIYQAPDLYNLLTSNLRSAIFHLREAIRYIDSAYQWNPNIGYIPKSNQQIDSPPFIFNTQELQMFQIDTKDEFYIQQELSNAVISQLTPPSQPEN